MVDLFRQQLDELLGADRDLLPEEKKNKQKHFDDERVCKFFLCGFCPHELFVNTKSDHLGPCRLEHDEECRKEFEQLSPEKKDRYGYEERFIRFLESMVNDADRKIRKAEEQAEIQNAVPEGNIPEEQKKRIDAINTRIEEVSKEIELLVEDAKVEEASTLMKLIDTLKHERDGIYKTCNVPMTALPDRKMQVCKVCGAKLVQGDTERRQNSHLEGKQHQGWELIRRRIQEYHKKRADSSDRKRSRDDGRSYSRDYDRQRGSSREYERRDYDRRERGGDRRDYRSDRRSEREDWDREPRSRDSAERRRSHDRERDHYDDEERDSKRQRRY